VSGDILVIVLFYVLVPLLLCAILDDPLARKDWSHDHPMPEDEEPK
jgi:hypothetical protein